MTPYYIVSAYILDHYNISDLNRMYISCVNPYHMQEESNLDVLPSIPRHFRGVAAILLSR